MFLSTLYLYAVSLMLSSLTCHLIDYTVCIFKELREVKRKSAALQMQQFVGEEKNDLLDYLRSLQPEKVYNAHLKFL